jgi:uncharacterized protein
MLAAGVGGQAYPVRISASKREHDMAAQERPSAQTDHVGLEVLAFGACLDKLASVPVGRVGFLSAGEVLILPVNHVLDGQSVVFRTAEGSKLAGAGVGYPVTFEADKYDALAEDGWSVVVHGYADVIDDDAEISRLDCLGLRSWGSGKDSYWVRIRPLSVTGRQISPAAR